MLQRRSQLDDRDPGIGSVLHLDPVVASIAIRVLAVGIGAICLRLVIVGESVAVDVLGLRSLIFRGAWAGKGFATNGFV